MKSVLLTGATGKIGSIFTKNMLREGWRVVAISRTADKLQSLKLEIGKEWHSNFVGIELNLGSPSYVETLLNILSDQRIYIDSIVNNARRIDTLAYDTLGYMPKENWAVEFDLGVVVPYQLTMHLLDNGHPIRNVVNIASMYGVVAPNMKLYEQPTQSPINYGVVKAAQIHLTKELAVRLAPAVKVNAISYGGVEGRAPESFKKRYAELAPNKKMLCENDIFGPLKFLLSEESSGMQGHNLLVEGGWTLW